MVNKVKIGQSIIRQLQNFDCLCISCSECPMRLTKSISLTRELDTTQCLINLYRDVMKP
jgi:hypothetical protein